MVVISTHALLSIAQVEHTLVCIRMYLLIYVSVGFAHDYAYNHERFFSQYIYLGYIQSFNWKTTQNLMSWLTPASAKLIKRILINYISLYKYTNICVCVCVYVYVYVCVFMYVFRWVCVCEAYVPLNIRAQPYTTTVYYVYMYYISVTFLSACMHAATKISDQLCHSLSVQSKNCFRTNTAVHALWIKNILRQNSCHQILNNNIGLFDINHERNDMLRPSFQPSSIDNENYSSHRSISMIKIIQL